MFRGGSVCLGLRSRLQFPPFPPFPQSRVSPIGISHFFLKKVMNVRQSGESLSGRQPPLSPPALRSTSTSSPSPPLPLFASNIVILSLFVQAASLSLRPSLSPPPLPVRSHFHEVYSWSGVGLRRPVEELQRGEMFSRFKSTTRKVQKQSSNENILGPVTCPLKTFRFSGHLKTCFLSEVLEQKK